jgi:hypothetical protein
MGEPAVFIRSDRVHDPARAPGKKGRERIAIMLQRLTTNQWC